MNAERKAQIKWATINSKQIRLSNQLQIIHSHGNSHWTRTQKRLAIQNFFKSRRIKMVKCQTQLGGDDCGVFAIANATAIAHDIDPTDVMYDESAMQWHLNALKKKI